MRVHLAHDMVPAGFEASTGEVAPADTEILVNGVPSAEVLDALPALKAVVVPWAGVPENTWQLCRERGLALYNLHHNDQATAEMAVALLFAVAKNIAHYDAGMRQGEWRERFGDRVGSLGLAGRTAVIPGYGSIGRCIGRMLSAVGMRVIGLRRTPEPDPHAEVWGADRLHEALPLAEALVIALPLTPQTRGLFGADELALLPTDAMLVNVGRAPIVDEAALYEAARSGRIRVGLDVWYRYPQGDPPHWPAEHPFWELPNVTLSPHHGGNVAGIEPVRMAALATLLREIEAGTAKAVDISLGY